MEQERLQKAIAKSGYTSRRKAENLIVEGKVKVNGKTVTELGTKVKPDDKIEVNNIPLEKEEPVYLLLYKPRGVISSVKDDRNRKVVTDLLPEIEERIFPIGRLDYDTSGLLLLTNDGDFAQLLMHPKYQLDKVYIAKVEGIPAPEDLKPLKTGIMDNGENLKAIKHRILSVDHKKNRAILEITLHEGKNRQIRRMMEALGYPVLKLKRERYGFLNLHSMNPGDYRELTPHEVKQLKTYAEKNVK
ncbi:23S rRNA pseudouridine2605 synthase [Salinibacillus kushneri]|uniref:Pseudouridine synthase n=1 Tax=Salinibacillus kushneri TaxID=237682 RepID=A0A1I0HYI6_9BACI|nr:pseudouridine synthase [Salinibacillus kushneri]SET89136.1 23S rRNA pseudouridine2605 synthase [Salinibacillus kushneri]